MTLKSFSLSVLLFFVTIFCSGQDKTSIKFLTYNVLADKVKIEIRAPAIFKILKESDADVIALQEADLWFLELLQQQEWAKKYNITINKENFYAQRGLLIMSKGTLTATEIIQLKSRQKRVCLIVETKIKGIAFKIATCHLDSYLEDGSTRAAQISDIFKYLNSSENAVLLGDFNFGDGEMPETKMLPEHFKDIWLEVNPKSPGYTWNIEKSLMAKHGSFPNEVSRRIDRILVKTKIYKPLASKIVGDVALDNKNELFPSDHFGLIGQLVLAVK